MSIVNHTFCTSRSAILSTLHTSSMPKPPCVQTEHTAIQLAKLPFQRLLCNVRDRSVTPRYGDVATRDSGGEEQTTGHGMTVLVEKYIYLYLLAPAPNICTKTNKHKSVLKPYSQLAY